MKYIIKIILLSILALNLGACDTTKNNIFAPNKKLFKMAPKDAPPNVTQGFLDGCETGLSTGFANDYYKTFYKFKKDIDMIQSGNVGYLRTWSTAMIYCRHYALGTLKEAGMTPKLPGRDKGMVLGEHSVFGNVFNPKNQGAVGLKNW